MRRESLPEVKFADKALLILGSEAIAFSLGGVEIVESFCLEDHIFFLHLLGVVVVARFNGNGVHLDSVQAIVRSVNTSAEPELSKIMASVEDC